MKNVELVINAKGYWRILIRPIEYNERVESLEQCKNIMEYASVSFRGWSFPYVDVNKIQNMSNWIEMETNWKQYIEFWKFFTSGQFAYKAALVEDYLIRDIEQNSSLVYYRGEQELPHKYLSILSSLYRVTEVFEFASRLVEKKILIGEIEITISIINTMDRMLFFWERDRDLRHSYICKIQSIDFKKVYNPIDLVSNKLEFANSCTQFIFEKFNWDRSPGNIFKEQQMKLVEKRL